MEVYKYDEEGKFADSVQEDMFGSHEDVMNYLSDKRVCNLIYDELRNVFMLGERCDDWYLANLDAQQCRELSTLFALAAEKIEENS